MVALVQPIDDPVMLMTESAVTETVRGTRVVIAMSGGVDSSVAAAILAEEGWDAIGIGMQLWDYSEAKESFDSCCSPFDVMDARSVASRLGIPYYLQNFQDQFRDEVVDVFIQEYQSGRTPSPCVLCNQRFKFDRLLRRAEELKAGKGRDRPLCARRMAGKGEPLRPLPRAGQCQGPKLFPFQPDPGPAGEGALPDR